MGLKVQRGHGRTDGGHFVDRRDVHRVQFIGVSHVGAFHSVVQAADGHDSTKLGDQHFTCAWAAREQRCGGVHGEVLEIQLKATIRRHILLQIVLFYFLFLFDFLFSFNKVQPETQEVALDRISATMIVEAHRRENDDKVGADFENAFNRARIRSFEYKPRKKGGHKSKPKSVPPATHPLPLEEDYEMWALEEIIWSGLVAARPP